MKPIAAFVLLVALAALFPTVAGANSITEVVGQVSFDTFLLPSPPVPGTNAFNLLNYTGGMGSDVTDAVFFNNASFLLVPTSGSPILIPVGNAGPGALLDSSGNPLFALQFADTSTFSSATFTGTLSQTTFLLINGVPATLVGSPTFTATITPSFGSSLTPGVDSALITITVSTPTATVPEPATMLLVGSGLLTAFGYRRRKGNSGLR
jgi:hypothetical protein